jgi:lambda repressor-like predicted transcriptional regulator
MKKDFNVKITVRNNHLLSMVMDKFESGAEFCRHSGISYGSLAKYMAMKVSPVGLHGWRESALDIASALNVYPSDLWPEHMQNVKLKTATAEVQLDAKEVQSIIAGGYEIDQVEASDLLSKISEDLSPRYKTFMQWRIAYGADATPDECAEVLGVSRARAWQIETIAMRMMRKRAKKLGVESISDMVA